MTLAQIGALVALAVVIGRLRRGRQLALLAVSSATVFWLQPHEALPTLGFWLPFGTLGITVLTWAVTSTRPARAWRDNWMAVAVLAGVLAIIAIAALSGLPLNPAIVLPAPSLGIVGGLTFAAVALLLWTARAKRQILLAATTLLILLAFVVIKAPGLAGALTEWVRSLASRGEHSATAGPIAWLGFSYVAFRLLHTLRDSQAGRLPTLGLGEYVNYVIFFPALTAGPIDRVEHFVQDLRSPLALNNKDWLDAAIRLVRGLFKKFVLADLLAVISISDLLVEHIRSSAWIWVFLYAYAFRLYLDFSGYTDIAVGMGRLMGVQLPENFQSPYLKQNLALFWNSWHMSLTQWFRSYVFNPMTRALRSGRLGATTWLIILLTQLITMSLIGLWHGITWNYALWGAWHGLGLFWHNRWAQFARERWSPRLQTAASSRWAGYLGTILTFNYVSVGWLFFGLSTPSLAWQGLRLLLGLGR